MADGTPEFLKSLPTGAIFSPLRVGTDDLSVKIDRAFRAEMWFLTLLTPRILKRLGDAMMGEQSEVRKDIAILLLNANTTTLAALELWRRGFPLQVGTLLRNAIETIATAGALLGEEKAYREFKRGNLKSWKAFTTIKRVWPVVGDQLARANGTLSSDFTHLGPLYSQWQAVTRDLTAVDLTALRAMLAAIKLAFHLLDMLSELVCYESTVQRLYWTKVAPNAYQYRPTPEGEEWLRTYLVEHPPETPAEPSPGRDEAAPTG